MILYSLIIIPILLLLGGLLEIAPGLRRKNIFLIMCEVSVIWLLVICFYTAIGMII